MNDVTALMLIPLIVIVTTVLIVGPKRSWRYWREAAIRKLKEETMT
jgi:hypothetical protein